MKEKIKIVKEGNVEVKIYTQNRKTPTGEMRTSYLVADYTCGVRKLRSFADSDEAAKAAKNIAERLSTGQATAAAISNPQAASFGRAMQLLKPTGISLEMAASIVATCFKLLGEDLIVEAVRSYVSKRTKTTPKLVPAVIEELLKIKKSRQAAPRYYEDLKNRLKRVGDGFQKKNIGDVTTANIQAWLDKEGLSTQGYCDYRNRMHLLFNFAVARGYAAENPVVKVEKIKVKRGAMEIYTPDEASKLLTAATPEFMPSLAIGLFSGVRSAEIERLTWAEVDLSAKYITIGEKQAKTASRRIVPISDNLAAWLATAAKKDGPIWAGTNFEFYHDGQQATAKTAGIKWKKNAMRHSYVSYRFGQIGDAGRVAGECGNSAEVINNRYRDLVRPEAAVKYFSIRPPSFVPKIVEKAA